MFSVVLTFGSVEVFPAALQLLVNELEVNLPELSSLAWPFAR